MNLREGETLNIFMQWYYAVGEKRIGPFNDEEFRRLIYTEDVESDTLVWCESMPKWERYASLPPELASLFARSPNVCGNCGKTFAPDEMLDLAGGRYCGTCKPVVVQRIREGTMVSSEVEELRKKFIAHEASIKSVGTLYGFTGTMMLLMGLSIGIPLMLEPEGIIMALTMLGVWGVMGGALLWVGICLRKLQGWTRIAVGILSGIGLIGVPIGTLINGYILYLVFSKKGQRIFSEEYQQVIAQTPHIKYRTAAFMWLLLGLVVLLVVLLILPWMWSR